MTYAMVSSSPCASASYRRAHPAECNKVVPGGGWPKCGDLCAYPEYRQAMPSECALGVVPPMRGFVVGVGDDIDMTKFLGCPASNGMQSQTNPLPAGRYWIDLIGEPNISDFMSTLAQAADAGVVVIENQQAWDPSFLDKLVGAGDSQMWVLWKVTGDGSFSMDATRYGMPTIAPDCVTTKDQTIQAPADPPSGVAAVPWWVWGGLGFIGFLLAAHGMAEVSSSVKTLKAAAEGS